MPNQDHEYLFFSSINSSLSDYINSVVNDIKSKFKLLNLSQEPRSTLPLILPQIP